MHSLELVSSLGEHSVTALAKCGALDEAVHIFCELPSRTAFSWTAIISGFLDCGHSQEALQLFVCMQGDRVEPDPYTFVSLFRACGNLHGLDVGRKLHAMAKRKDFAADAFVVSVLVSMYGKCGAIEDAENAFVVTCNDVVVWNSMLSAYVEGGEAEKSLQLYTHMQVQAIIPDKESLVMALQACGTLASEKCSFIFKGEHNIKEILLEIGRELHADARHKTLTDVFLTTTLLSMYGKCGSTWEAEKAFGESFAHGVVPCTAMISAYVELDEKVKALKLYRQMQREGIRSNQRTLVCALQACESILNEGESLNAMSVDLVKALHCDAMRRGMASDLFVSNALISLYGSCGAFTDAENVFVKLQYRDVVSWTALLSNFVDLGRGPEALQLYREMHVAGVNPNHRTFVVALQSCVVLCDEKRCSDVIKKYSVKMVALEIAQALYTDVKREGLSLDVFITTALISIYGKCGNLVEAENMVQSLPNCCTALRNAMLSVYLDEGNGWKALESYEQIRQEKIVMDACTLISVLQACSQVGVLDTSREIHFVVICAGFELHAFLASALIRAYGSNATMNDAAPVACGLPHPDIVSLNACLAGYAGEGQCSSCLHTFEEIKQARFAATEASFVSLLSCCSRAGLVEEGLEYFCHMGGCGNVPTESKQFVTIVDLLARAGDLKKVGDMLHKMLPMQASADVWLCLLSACCTHGYLELGKLAFMQAINLEPEQRPAYVLMSNIYADLQAASPAIAGDKNLW